jgi:hypothetical protein
MGEVFQVVTTGTLRPVFRTISIQASLIGANPGDPAESPSRTTARSGLSLSTGKHGADLNQAVTLGAVPHTGVGPREGRVSRSWWRSSLGRPPI